MEQATLEHANTFFFITTIAVGLLIVILIVVLYAVYRVSIFVKKTMDRVDSMLEKAGDRVDGFLDKTEENIDETPVYKKALPLILPILGKIFLRKRSTKRKM